MTTNRTDTPPTGNWTPAHIKAQGNARNRTISIIAYVVVLFVFVGVGLWAGANSIYGWHAVEVLIGAGLGWTASRER